MPFLRFKDKNKQGKCKEKLAFAHDLSLPSAFRPSTVNPSQLARPYLASSLPSSFRDMAPIRITCDGWHRGGIFDWYRRQRHTIIRKLELRKERDNFKHEFVMIYLDNGWVHRVERRPLGGANTDTISSRGCEAEDSLTPVSDDDLEHIRPGTDAEIVIEFDSNKPDLYAIIAICVAIRLDAQTENYTLQQYNCYFVARSIMTLITRHCLLRAPSMTSLRWDGVTEHAILNHVFGGDWNTLDKAIKLSMATLLEKLLWDVIEKDAGTRLEKQKDWEKLKRIVKSVILEEVERSSTMVVVEEVKKAVNDWIIDATQVTLWRGNLEQNILEPRYRQKYEITTESILKKFLKPELEMQLPNNMLKRISGVLPERMINRIPPTTLASLPPELMARVPISVLEKLPDDLLAKLPNNLLRNAPIELLQKIPVHTFSRLKNSTIVTLPDDLDIIPPKLLEISLQRMEALLDEAKEHPERAFALKLLQRLPEDRLSQLAPKYVAMRDEASPDLPVEPDEEVAVGTSDQEYKKPRCLSLHDIKKSWDQASFLGFLMRIAPMPVLRHLPIFVMEVMPTSSLKLIPAEALERIPPEYLARMKESCLERLPEELLVRCPPTMLRHVPRSTLERLPTSLLERLPKQLLRNLPPELLENIPEDLTDLLRQVIATTAFEGEQLKQELVRSVREIIGQTLFISSGEFPSAAIQVSVRARSKASKNDGTLRKHEEFQEHILDMVKKHSKKVAQVAQLGVGEEKVYSELRSKTEDIWQVMRLHSIPPSRV